jgi:hypothetical protein
MQMKVPKCLNFSFPPEKSLKNAFHGLPVLSFFASQRVMPGPMHDLPNALMSITGGVVGNIQMIEEIFVHLHSVPRNVMEADRFG